MNYQDVDVKRLLEAFGRAQLEIHQLRDLGAMNVLRIRELEKRLACALSDNALLSETLQKDVATVRMEREGETPTELIPEVKPDEPEQPPNVRIIRSRTAKSDNPALFLSSD